MENFGRQRLTNFIIFLLLLYLKKKKFYHSFYFKKCKQFLISILFEKILI